MHLFVFLSTSLFEQLFDNPLLSCPGSLGQSTNATAGGNFGLKIGINEGTGLGFSDGRLLVTEIGYLDGLEIGTYEGRPNLVREWKYLPGLISLLDPTSSQLPLRPSRPQLWPRAKQFEVSSYALKYVW